MDHAVLIVDDSQSFVPELRETLQQQGYKVITALRGEEALDILRSERVDLVITEALLSGIDGFDLVRKIRQNDAWHDLPIVMLTVRAAPDDYVAGFDAGVDEYFTKPTEDAKLLAAIRAFLTRHDQRRQKNAMVPATPVLGTRGGRGQIITVFSLKGGVGASTISVNLTVALKQLMPSARVGLIDLAFEQGIDALMLDVVPTSTILEWARESMDAATPYLLNQYFVPHRTGVSLLAAPPSPEDAEIVRPDVVRRTLEMVRQAFDYVVVDTSSTFSENNLIALESADTIVIPLTPDMAALKTAVATIRILDAVKISQDKLRFVLNEIVPRAGLTVEQVEGSLRHDVYEIAHAGPTFLEASNQGLPVTAMHPVPPAGRVILDLARTMCNPEVVETQAERAAAEAGIGSVLGRFGLKRSSS